MEGSSSRNTITVYVYGKPLPEGVTYKSRNEIIEEASRQAEAIYTNDASIPTGYQLERVQGHKYYVAEAYQDKYVDGKLAESKLLYTDKYKGNPPEVSIGIRTNARSRVAALRHGARGRELTNFRGITCHLLDKGVCSGDNKANRNNIRRTKLWA